MMDRRTTSNRNTALINKRKVSYATLAVTFAGFFAVNSLNAEIQWYDVDPDDAFVSFDEDIFTGGNSGYIIDIDRPENVNDLIGAEALLKIVNNAFLGVSSDFGVVIDQQFVELAKTKFMGSVALYQYPTVMPTFASVYAQAAKLQMTDIIGPMNLEIEGRTVGETGFVNRSNGTSGAFVKLASGNGGQWQEGIGFLGVKFEIGEATHYGWIELDVLGGTVAHGDNTNNFNFIVKSFAYEDCPDISIRMGEKTLSFCEDVSIESQSKTFDSVSIYPNPIQNKSFIEFTSLVHTNLQVELVGYHGQNIRNVFNCDIVKEKKYKIDLDTDELANGVYFLRFVVQEEEVLVKKIQIIH